MASRILANLVVIGSGILGRAVFQTYRKAIQSRNGVAKEALKNIRRSSKTMNEQEARQILGVSEDSTWEDALKRYDNLFLKNAKNGSFYLQSKIHTAKECLQGIKTK
ncbi:Mitochondrial import inner membrane translocase subunit TIM16 [Zostera marina]|uniref:Mitochondrial import inner membrane translocase subunit TIM16 n=1 Tax=Zostera marina TaxID=29655 RepID=A0A0K9PET1_ZOSMR|nr:Mitochondrial import inner membrane translocase subunit TIM16 [Zostera marina]